MKKILLVGERKPRLVELYEALIQNMFSVTLVESADRATSELTGDSDQVLVTYFEGDEKSGIECLEALRSRFHTPVILLVSSLDGDYVSRLEKLDVDELIVEPFEVGDVLASVEACLVSRSEGADSSGGSKNLDLDFCKLGIEEFISGRILEADLYLRIFESKYLKIARKDAPVSVERIKTYKSKGVRYLFVRKEQFSTYVGFNVKLSRAAMVNKRINREKRLRLLQNTSEVIMEDAFINGINKARFEEARWVVESTVNLLSEEPNLFDLMDKLNSHVDHLYAHSLAVSLYSSMLAQSVGWKSAPTLYKISMGGLLHDIGKKEIDRAILLKPRIDLSVEEIKVLESHALRGKEILSQVPAIAQDVIQIIMQHHESISGRGYPSGLKKDRIHPLARLVAVVDEFCELVIKGPNKRCCNPSEAIEELVSFKMAELDPVYMVALMDMFDYPVPQEWIKFRSAKLSL